MIIELLGLFAAQRIGKAGPVAFGAVGIEGELGDRQDLSADDMKERLSSALANMREIAEAYGVSESKVKMTLSRTRTRLKSFLDEEGADI